VRSLPALCLAAALASALPAAARAASVSIPAPSVENAGGALIVRQSDSAASLVGVTLIVRAGLDRQTMKQNGLAALVAETIVRTPLRQGQDHGVALEDAIAARGGSIHFTVDPGDIRFYVEALAPDAPAVLDLFRSAIAAPDFSPSTIRDARAVLVLPSPGKDKPPRRFDGAIYAAHRMRLAVGSAHRRAPGTAWMRIDGMRRYVGAFRSPPFH